MLNPTPSDQTPATEGPGVRATRAKAATPAPNLDPSWRAGRKLTEARQQLGLTIEEVAERIRVRKEFLEALEDMNIKLLPGKAYAVAFLRSYARELGIDERAIVDQFQDESALTREDVQSQIRNPTSKPGRDRPWLAAAALVVIAAGFVGFRALQTSPPEDGASTQQTEVAASASPGGTTPAAAVEARVVEIRAIVPAWLEARGPDGTVFLSRDLQAGDVYRPDASPGWTLHARDGGAFELFVNGASAGLLGTPAMPVLGRQIDEIHPITQAQIASPRS
jgi:transcriptional regulator with XRE-family HTH domain